MTWINGTVIPAAGDPDVLLLGDFNSYAHEDPVTTLEAGGYTDLETSFDPNTYSYLFSAELGHLDYGFASTSLLPQVTGAAPWHINADEVDLFDYNDEIKDAGEATFEEKPDGSALVPPRVVFAPGTPYRASDHDPVLVGLFPVADLAITKTDGVTTATPGGSVTYTITASNAGPNKETGATVADTFPAVADLHLDLRRRRRRHLHGLRLGQPQRHRQPAERRQRHLYGELHDLGRRPPARSPTRRRSRNGTTSDSNAANNSATDTDTLTPQADLAHHQDGRGDHGDRGRLGDLHDHGVQRRPEQRDGRDGGGHLPGVADLHLDLRGRRRRHLHGVGLGQHQRHGQPAERRQRDLHGELHGLGRGHRHARATRRR